LQGFLKPTEGSLGVSGASLGEALHGGLPLLGLAHNVVSGGLWVTNKAAKHTVAGPDSEFGGVGAGEVRGGALEVALGRDEDALLGIRIVAEGFAPAVEFFEEVNDVVKLAGNIAVVGIPDVEVDVGDLELELLDEGKEADGAGVHGDGVTLSDTDLTVDDEAGAGGIVDC
jgi:hypothetical protein